MEGPIDTPEVPSSWLPPLTQAYKKKFGGRGKEVGTKIRGGIHEKSKNTTLGIEVLLGPPKGNSAMI